MNYNEDSDDWLAADDRLGEWAVVYHGVSPPQNKLKGKNILEYIGQARKDKSIFKLRADKEQ